MIHKDNLISIKFRINNYIHNPVILNKNNNFAIYDGTILQNIIDGDIIMEFNDITISLIGQSSTPISLNWFENGKMRIFGIDDNVYYLKHEKDKVIAFYFNDEKIGEFSHDD